MIALVVDVGALQEQGLLKRGGSLTSNRLCMISTGPSRLNKW